MPRPDFSRIASDVRLGRDVQIHGFVNLYGCTIGADTRIGPFVEIQKGAVVGERCKISSHSFVCEGVEIEDEVFIGHGVMFTNDRYPKATGENGQPLGDGEWVLERTVVRRRTSIGSGAVILPGLEIGEGATIGAGAVVTRDVAPGEVVSGVPARASRGADTPSGRAGGE